MNEFIHELGEEYILDDYKIKKDVVVFKKENDEHCLHMTHRNRETGEESTTWYHTVLEAKIVLGDAFVVSIASEFIENNAEDAQRQKEMVDK